MYSKAGRPLWKRPLLASQSDTIALLVVLLIMFGSPVPARCQTRLDSTSERVLSERIARLEGAVAAQVQQLEIQRSVATNVVETTANIVTFGTILIGAVAGLLGLLGYRDLRRRLEESVQKRVESITTDRTDALVEARLRQFEEKWDQRLGELADRADRLIH